MLQLFRYMQRKDRLLACVCLVLIVLQVQVDLAMPDYMAEITRLVQTEGSAMADILAAGGKMLACAVASLASAVAVGYLAARISANFSQNLRAAVYDKVLSFSEAETARFSTSSLITRTTNDITQVQMVVVMGLQLVVKAPIMAALAVLKIRSKSMQWTQLTLGVVAAIILILLAVVRFALPRFKKIQWLTDDLNRVTRENLDGLLVVRAYNAEPYQQQKFEAANHRLTRNNLEANLAMGVLMPAINLGMNLLTLGIYWIGARLIAAVALTGAESLAQRVGLFSDMVVFTSYAMQVVMSFLMLVMIFIMLPRAMVAAQRICEVLNTQTALQNGSRQRGEGGMRGCVEFRHVSFAYPEGGEVLHDISFSAARGQTVALIGATGCGKSTIVNLIPRLYDATAGQVLVDGVDVKQYDQHALRAKIGFVPQKAFLFSGTIESNVGYGLPEPDRDAVARALDIAQASDFVAGNYSAAVAQEGGNFSGGQKQRLAIARALAKQPEILVFDDSFSALDYRTDRILRGEIKKRIADTTCIIVAQRIGTIRDADRILVIEDGRIVGDGTHSQLMAGCKAYQEIAYSQLSKEELSA